MSVSFVSSLFIAMLRFRLTIPIRRALKEPKKLIDRIKKKDSRNRSRTLWHRLSPNVIHAIAPPLASKKKKLASALYPHGRSVQGGRSTGVRIYRVNPGESAALSALLFLPLHPPPRLIIGQIRLNGGAIFFPAWPPPSYPLTRSFSGWWVEVKLNLLCDTLRENKAPLFDGDTFKTLPTFFLPLPGFFVFSLYFDSLPRWCTFSHIFPFYQL